MKTKHRFSKTLSKIVCMVMITGVWTGAIGNIAAAENTSATVTINGGPLAITVIPNSVSFGSVELDGTVQTTKVNLSELEVTDARGTGAGWGLSVVASPFQSGENSLPTGSLSLKAPTITAGYENPSTAPSVSPVFGTEQAIDGESPWNLIVAANNEGLGKWKITWSNEALTLTLNPATTKVGTYTSTITWTLGAYPEV
jgi:hypothetical protein